MSHKPSDFNQNNLPNLKSKKQNLYIFFKHDPIPCSTQFELQDTSMIFTVWRSSLFHLAPKGISLNWRHFLYEIFFFKCKYYKAFLVYTDSGKLVHQSYVFPKYFRFPFMRKRELQITGLWTDKAFRDKGIAKFVVQEIIKANPNCAHWFLARIDNMSSVKVASENNFIDQGLGSQLLHIYRFLR
jgi:GNAT superfamily N-acetyltransferase